MMNEKRFQLDIGDDYCFINDKIEDKTYAIYNDRFKERWSQEIVDLLNNQQAIIHRDEISIKTMMSNMKKLEEEKEYWKSKAMTLLLQVRRLTPRMTDKEVIEFSKELEDE